MGKTPTAAKAPPRPRRQAVPQLRIDPAKYPNVGKNPGLERALWIRQALDQGKPREEAVALADEVLGPRSKLATSPRPKRTPRKSRK